MKALSYLVLRKFKNRFLEIVKKPSQLILLIVFVLLIGFTAFSSEITHYDEFRDINELYSAVMLLYTVVFVLVSKNGFSNGASIFSMADVNLLFVSPFKNTTVLFYGLLSQLGRSLTLGLFILYQSALVRSTYGVGFSALVYILIGYGITVFLSQMLAMLIYSLTSSNDKNCLIAKIGFYSVIGVYVLLLIYKCIALGGVNLQNLVAVSGTTLLKSFPVSGMMSVLTEGMISADVKLILYGIAYAVLFCVVFYTIIYFTAKDFYEDVLKSAEVSFTAITARKEGKAQENTPRNVKVGKTGFKSGIGATALYEKHKIENRRSRTFMVSGVSIVFVLLTAVYCYVMPEPIGIFALNVYMLTIGVGTGRWAKELLQPYVYLIPEKNSKKLFNILREQFPSMAVESVLCFIPVYLILKLSIAEIIGMIVARITFGFLFIGINLILQRLFGSSDKKLLVITVYFVFILLFSVPAIAAGVLLGMYLPFNPEFAYFAVALINVPISAVILFCCRNILEYADYNNK